VIIDCSIKRSEIYNVDEILDISTGLTLSKASTILALPAWTVMSDNAPGGPDWSAPVETSDETGVNLTIVTTTSHTSHKYHVLLLLVMLMVVRMMMKMLSRENCYEIMSAMWHVEMTVSMQRIVTSWITLSVSLPPLPLLSPFHSALNSLMLTSPVSHRNVRPQLCGLRIVQLTDSNPRQFDMI